MNFYRFGSRLSNRPATLSNPWFRGRDISSSAVCHGRWSKISRDKGVSDLKKGRIYAQMSLEIARAARKGGSDPANNLELSVALRKARDLNVPKDNIKAALARASSPQSAEDTMQTSVYEAIGPGQTPLLIECQSNNSNRTFKRIKELLSDQGCRMAPVAYMFARKGKIVLTPREGATFEEVWEAAVDANANDAEELTEDDTTVAGQAMIEVTTEPSDLAAISTTLSAPPHSHTITSMELVYVPASEEGAEGNGADSMDEETRKKLEALLTELRDEGDCENVWTLNGM